MNYSRIFAKNTKAFLSHDSHGVFAFFALLYMQPIKNFLEKFRNIIRSDKELKNKIVESIQKETSVRVSESKIKIKENTAFIQENPIVKSEIFLKKEKILIALKGLIRDLR